MSSAGRKDIGHSGVLEHYRHLIVKHLTLTSPVYRRLKENGILTTEQIGLLELKESSEQKVSKLIEVLKSKDHHVFTSFCAVLHETGHHHLAQVLQKASSNRTSLLPEVPTITQHKQVLNEAILLHKEYDGKLKEENLQLRRKIQRMKSKYVTKLQGLEEKITLAKWERDLAIKEKNILHNENEALQKLNTELRALVTKLEEATFHSDLLDLRTYHSNIQDLGFSVDYLKEKSRRLYPETHLGLVYR
ncbi:uncharacterized protein LOC130311259 [Hyla sarda]|uniref:uncharacterized protein LOC130311259 n=1 Tax=Hyla sarda TaxID=327740 RepID=UPI0024C313FD|nr:uncharacterized protein LOC130311259 [Hyla sarda]